MFTPLGNPRGLPYPLQSQISNGNITSDAGLPLNEFVWPEDPEERTILPLYLSQREFTAILSAMDVGADIAYPEQYVEVMWLMVRNLRYGVNICEMIAECIATSEATQQALRDFVTSDPSVREYMDMVVSEGAPMPTGVATGEMIGSEDLDALFGAVTYLVDTMNGANEDLYQAIEASSNNREGGQILFEAIPVFETLPLDEVSEYVDFLVSSVAENYAAAYTTTPITGLRDRLRCGLFCLARDNGDALTWNQVADFFWAQVDYTPADYVEIIEDFVTFVTTGSWTGEEIATISFANIASVLSGAQVFAGMTFPDLKAIMALGLNDPDSDWMTLCEDCPPPPVDDAWTLIIAPGYETGIITGQTAHRVDFEAEMSFDGIWRVNAERLVGCPPLTGFGTTGATITYIYKELCAGGSSSDPIAIGDEIRNFAYAANAIFTMYLEW